MAHRVKKGLPFIDGGDVEIRLSRRAEDRLVLLSSHLTLHSPWFSISLSDTWTKDEQHEQGPIKWLYELEFDGGDSPTLVRRSSAFATARQSRYNDYDFYVSNKLAESKLHAEVQSTTRSGWVQAHKCFFNVLFHEDLGIACEGPALTCLQSTILVADMYLCPELLKMPTKLFLQDNLPRFQGAMLRCGAFLLNICSFYEFNTIAKDIICHLVGDETRDDAWIRTELNSELSDLVLAKRACLRKKMADIDLKLLTLETFWGKHQHEQSITSASGCFRDYMVEILRSSNKRPWTTYAEPYRRIMADNGKMDPERRFRRYSFRTPVRKKTALTHFRNLQMKAVKTIKPLLSSKFVWLKPLEEYPNRAGQISRWRGFSCIEITDEDLPWNKK